MTNKEKINDDFKIYCCFSTECQDVESVIGLVFIDYLNVKLKENNQELMITSRKVIYASIQ